MRNPTKILYALSEKDESFVHNDLYRILYNKDYFLGAYGRIQAKEGNMTPGTDGKTVDGFNLETIDHLVDRLKNQTYQPNPARRKYIEKKKSNKKRPLGIPSFEDKLVQVIVADILNAIYEKTFSEHSHGFRPERSCHTALNEIKRDNNGTRWWVEGDIKGFFDNIDHHVLIEILKRRIKDQRFISLIWKFLKAGYLEEWEFHNTYSGTPQGGIISPILSNIYLNEFDKYMEECIREFNRGKDRKRNLPYKRLSSKCERLRKKARENWDIWTDDEKSTLLKELKETRKLMDKIPAMDPMDENFRRMHYTRYADDFLIGVIGSKDECVEIKKQITEFLKSKLKLDLSQEKTLITHSTEKVRFLGYNIVINKSTEAKPVKGATGKQRITNNKPFLLVPHEKIRDFLLDKLALKINLQGEWKSAHRAPLIRLGDYEILTIYNAEIRGLYNYYKLANDVYKLNGMYHIMRYSFVKTLGSKHQRKVAKIMVDKKNYMANGELGVWFETVNGKKFAKFYNEGFKKVKETDKDHKLDGKPNIAQHYKSRTSIEQRLLANVCEWCGETKGKMEVHHVRKLKNLKGKKNGKRS